MSKLLKLLKKINVKGAQIELNFILRKPVFDKPE
jgi:hypothetical protein